MQKQAKDIITEALEAVAHATSEPQLEQLRVNFLGKKGRLTELLKTIGEIPADQRKTLGELLNNYKNELQDKITEQKQLLLNNELNNKLTASVDVSLPGCGIERGSLHPITNTLETACRLFEQLGFDLIEGPEIDNEYHNFEALNIPFHHPARAMHDTFYFPDGKLLRTHTSNVQIRVMENNKPPFRLISMGKVYRCDSDLTHTPMFHQLEGLLVDYQVNFGHLTEILTEFLRCFFAKKDLMVRFRPSYFPFTEPSAEVDIRCVNCNSKGCKVCKNTGWLEILGCGMVHPEVLKNCNIDGELYSGWAFGLGLDRLAMLRYGITDLRLMFENDLRFLQQF
ncbi:MAG: phenylalanine--tRNA ligase subunit alpha [Gammaproteobacteria bacterium]|jgi:phenylalanyl-tRNA synthetase alpha chain